MYVIICELLGISKIIAIVRATKDAQFKQLLKTHYAQTHFLNNYIRSLYIVLLIKNSLRKAAVLFLIFISISTGHAHFQSNNTDFLGSERLTRCFSVVKCQKSALNTRKAGYEACGKSVNPVFNWERNLLSKQCLPVRNCNTGFGYSLHFLYTSCFYN